MNYDKRRVIRLLTEGLCPRCKQPLDRRGVLCVVCTQKQAAAYHAKYHERRLLGLCVRCKISTSNAYCSNCKSKRCRSKESRKRLDHLEDLGLCAGCRQSIDREGIYCTVCCKKLREYRLTRKAKSANIRLDTGGNYATV